MATCPHCHSEKPVAAPFCHSCNRRTSLGLHVLAGIVHFVVVMTLFPLCIWLIVKGIMFFGS